jgi:imidazolonepropionase-like amidohydrolase
MITMTRFGAPLRVLAGAVTLFAAWRPATAQIPAVPTQRTTAFVNATVIPMDRERTLDRQTVIVRDGRITAIGPASSTDVPADAIRIDAMGKFLMPGLTEMHGHVPGQAGPLAHAAMFLFVANGVTTVRGMQGSPYHLSLREQIARGEVLGPRFYAAGPQMAAGIRTPAIADSVVRAQKAAGYDLLKIQSYDATVAMARSVGIPFGGHVPDSVGLWHALEARQGTIDHLDNYMDAVTAADFPAAELARVGTVSSNAPYARQIAAVAAATKRAGVAVVPTMPLWEMLYIPPDSASVAGRAELRYMPRTTVATWFRNIGTGGRVQGDSARRAWKAMRMDILRALNDAGVPILLGTDAPQVFSVPGFSVHREMQSMVEAGMTPYQVLQSGTRNVATHFGTLGETGTVEVGKRADLLLLDANPLLSVANAQRRAGVMFNGRWLPESEIQRGLAALAAGYAAQ